MRKALWIGGGLAALFVVLIVVVFLIDFDSPRLGQALLAEVSARTGVKMEADPPPASLPVAMAETTAAASAAEEAAEGPVLSVDRILLSDGTLSTRVGRSGSGSETDSGRGAKYMLEYL